MFKGILAAGVAVCALGGALTVGAYAATTAAKPPPPVANYWMDVATASGFGAGMTPGAKPNMSQIMGMMSGGSSVGHTLDLRLASRQKPAAGPEAAHFIPPTLQMGASLPLVTPVREPAPKAEPWTPGSYEKPKGRMLIYWGCGEHVAAAQPTVIDFAKLASGQMPAGMANLAMMGRAATPPQFGQSAGFGEWPNKRDSRAVPAAGSLVGAHKVEGNYSPPIGFSLGQGQDFMPALGLTEAGTLPSGASRLTWRPAAQATGYAIAMFGSNQAGDVIIWTSSKNAASSANLDYLPPSEVKRLVTAGAVLAPTESQCLLPAEVAKASPTGMLMMIGYGPEAHFAEAPKAPKWTARVRYKTTASLMRGMGEMMGGSESGSNSGQPAQQQPKKKKRGFGLGDVLQGATGIPIP
jgi:hypothetical protein